MNIIASILHYNNVDLTQQCIDSIRKTSSIDILVIDNGSKIPYIFDNVINLRREKNDCVGGMNLGFLYAVRNNYDFVVNFDNDIICLDGWLQPLLDTMKDETVGICGGKQLTKDKSAFRSVGMDLIGGTLYFNYPVEEMPVVWIQGSFVMLRSKMILEIGVHDTRFKHICSDSDYCIHANDRGWKVVFNPKSEVIHLGSSSMNGVCESYVEDNEKLVQKWCGYKFNELMKKFPLDIKEQEFIEIEPRIVKKDVRNIKVYEQKDYVA